MNIAIYIAGLVLFIAISYFMVCVKKHRADTNKRIKLIEDSLQLLTDSIHNSAHFANQPAYLQTQIDSLNRQWTNNLSSQTTRINNISNMVYELQSLMLPNEYAWEEAEYTNPSYDNMRTVEQSVVNLNTTRQLDID